MNASFICTCRIRRLFIRCTRGCILYRDGILTIERIERIKKHFTDFTDFTDFTNRPEFRPAQYLNHRGRFPRRRRLSFTDIFHEHHCKCTYVRESRRPAKSLPSGLPTGVCKRGQQSWLGRSPAHGYYQTYRVSNKSSSVSNVHRSFLDPIDPPGGAFPGADANRRLAFPG